MEDSPGPGPDGEAAPPLARRIWGELVCLCGRCKRLKLSECHCRDAKAERDRVVAQLAARDVASPNAARAAHDAVIGSYVARYGKRVLASESDDAADWQNWAAAAALVVAAVGGIVVIERYQRTRRKAPRRRRS